MATYKLDRPAQHTSLEVLVIGKLTALQNLNGINDRHAAIEFTARNIIIEILIFFKKLRFKLMNNRVRCGTIPQPLEAYALQQNAQPTHP